MQQQFENNHNAIPAPEQVLPPDDNGDGIYGRLQIEQVRIRTEADGVVWAARVLRRVCPENTWHCSRCRQLVCAVTIGGFKFTCEVEDDERTGMLLCNLTCEHECATGGDGGHQ